jgi:hypothetical protein
VVCCCWLFPAVQMLLCGTFTEYMGLIGYPYFFEAGGSLRREFEDSFNL